MRKIPILLSLALLASLQLGYSQLGTAPVETTVTQTTVVTSTIQSAPAQTIDTTIIQDPDVTQRSSTDRIAQPTAFYAKNIFTSTFDTPIPLYADNEAKDSYYPSDNEKSNGFLEIVMNYLDSPLVDIVWCGDKKNILFLLTENKAFYRSKDDGSTGHNLSDHLHKLGKAELGNEPGEVGQVSQIMQSPLDKNMLIIVGTQSVNWITEDCGVSFRATNQGRKVDEFQFHPVERTWLLASAWTVCDDFVGEPCRNFKKLFVSKDLGNNWEIIGGYIYQFSWALPNNSSRFSMIPRERILIAYDPRGKGNQTKGGWTKHHQVAALDNFGKDVIPLVNGGNKFLLTDNFLFVVQAKEESQQDVTLLVANPSDKNYNFREIETPTKEILEHGYTVLDVSEHAVFLHINHGGAKSPYGSLYVSDSTGLRYTQALKHQVRDSSGQCDFERVKSLEGIYLTNVYDADIVAKFSNQEAGPWNQKKLEDFKKTRISFNRGSIWRSLVPPEKDAFGQSIRCTSEEECFLHLHSISSRNFGPLYTPENSLGLVLGTGNVGEFLSNRPDEINTYLSRDGGLNWFQIAKGSHIYEIGNHGGIIVMAPDQTATKDIYYSWNEGLSWEAARISDSDVHINNIIIKPSNTGEKFIVYGSEVDGTRGVIASVDFTTILKRACLYPDRPDTPDSDFETWSPNGRISPHCLLGRQVTHTRKKREAECFNTEEYERWQFVHSCECTEDDWECDLGYSRIGSGPCLPISENIANQSVAAPEVCESYYFMTKGYRKISGDSCSGGVNYEAIRLPCPEIGLLTSQGFFTSKGFTVMLLLGAILFTFILISKTENANKITLLEYVSR